MARRKVKTLQLPDMAKLVGLHTFCCPNCEKKFYSYPLLKELFKQIIINCSKQYDVGIDRFGVFKSFLYKKERYNSLSLKMKKDIKDKLLLKFKPYNATKERINEYYYKFKDRDNEYFVGLDEAFCDAKFDIERAKNGKEKKEKK